MKKLEEAIKRIFVEEGIVLENWRVRITWIYGSKHSDYRDVTVEVIKPRCRKPCTIWTLKVDIVREIIDFSKSSFVRP